MYRLMASYEQNKIHIYKWRELNKEKHSAINIKSRKWKEIQKIYLAILLN
jgi:hypothetical protein